MQGSLGKTTLVVLLALSLSGCAQLVQSFQDQVSGQRGPGANYEAYLTGDRKLVVELDHSPGALWDRSTDADEDFRRQIERITAKDVEIRVNNELPDRSEDYAWSPSELRELHSQHQDLSSNQERVVMHALFVDGRSGANSDSVGVAYDADAFALFEGKIDDVSSANGCAIACGGPQQWKVMRAVSIHEAGHLLGLVNSPLPMVTPHEDPDHKAHSDNSDSVMFWKVENSGGISDLFGGGDVPWQFDSDDIQDAKDQRSGSS